VRLSARIATPLAALTLTAALAACGGGSTQAGTAAAVTVRLGYLPNLTHAAAIVGIEKGYFAQALGSTATLSTQAFNAGPAEVEAMNGDAIDVAFFGPNPAINAFSKSKGRLVRIVAGAAAGGAGLVVRSDLHITDASQLRGRKLGTPQLGNTQDVALRYYLTQHGLNIPAQGKGDVDIASADNSTLLTLFKSGGIDGAWVPEPWLSRMVDEGHGTVLVDESSLWPDGRFPTTELVVATAFLDAHPDVVRRLVAGLVTTVDWINANTSAAQAALNDGLLKLTQKKLSAQVLGDAWPHVAFSVDPLAAALATEAAHAHKVGLLGSVDLHGIIDVRALNAALRAKGEATVSSGGYGSE
jgi:NitT/TauT family transport system substrate-binding protein